MSGRSFRRHAISLRGAVGQWAAPVEGLVSADVPAEFRGDGIRVEVDDVSVVRVRLTPTRYGCRHGMPDVLDVVQVLDGRVRYSSPGGGRELGVGDLAFARPTSGDVFEAPMEASILRITMPAAALAAVLLPAGDLPLLEVPRPSAQPLIGMASGLLRGPRHGPPSTVAALRAAIVGLTGALLSESLGDAARPPVTGLVDRAHRYIEEHLAEPVTTTGVVAAALGTGVRTLQLAFEQQGSTVTRHIRRRRLEEVDRALASGSAESIAALAHRFGFSSPDRLSRAYRSEHGMTVAERRAGQVR